LQLARCYVIDGGAVIAMVAVVTTTRLIAPAVDASAMPLVLGGFWASFD